MKQDHHKNPVVEPEIRKLRQASAAARAMLGDAAEELRAVLQDDAIMAETPVEVSAAMECTLDAIGAALRGLESADVAKRQSAVPVSGGPTRRQGQFLAFIREYMMRNEAGMAPTHADLQRSFNLTPPSVNSMLIRLERRGFIRRVPGQARAIELTINPDWIPPLDPPFRI
jgi:LexA DNA binding domain